MVVSSINISGTGTVPRQFNSSGGTGDLINLLESQGVPQQAAAEVIQAIQQQQPELITRWVQLIQQQQSQQVLQEFGQIMQSIQQQQQPMPPSGGGQLANAYDQQQQQQAQYANRQEPKGVLRTMWDGIPKLAKFLLGGGSVMLAGVGVNKLVKSSRAKKSGSNNQQKNNSNKSKDNTQAHNIKWPLPVRLMAIPAGLVALSGGFGLATAFAKLTGYAMVESRDFFEFTDVLLDD